MYDEYQRQEEENIKKGKKGFVSTISGLSAQASSIKGGVEMTEMDDNSQTPESEKDYESADLNNLLAEGKGSEEGLRGAECTVDQVRVEVHNLLVDIKAEKVEATEVKLEDMDRETLGLSENGTLVGMDSLLDNIYCASVEKLNGNVNSLLLPKGSMDDQNEPPLITLDDDKETIPNSNNFLFGKVPGKLLSDLSPIEPLILPHPDHPVHTSTSDKLGLLAHMTGSSELGSLPSVLEKEDFELKQDLQGNSSVAVAKAEASNRPEVSEDKASVALEKNPSILNNSDNSCDTDKSDNIKDKEKKIQTSTTQVGPEHNHQIVSDFFIKELVDRWIVRELDR